MKISSRIALIGKVERKEGKRRKKKDKEKEGTIITKLHSFKGLKLYANQATASWEHFHYSYLWSK